MVSPMSADVTPPSCVDVLPVTGTRQRDREAADRLVARAGPDVDARVLDLGGDLAPIGGRDPAGERLRGRRARHAERGGLREHGVQVVQQRVDVDAGVDVVVCAPPTFSVPTTVGFVNQFSGWMPSLVSALDPELVPGDVDSWPKLDSSFWKRRLPAAGSSSPGASRSRRCRSRSRRPATLRPSALALTVKLDSGSLPAPRVWNGPPKLSVIGPLSRLDPDGSIVSVRSRFPLVTVCVPVKVWLQQRVGIGGATARAAACCGGRHREHGQHDHDHTPECGLPVMHRDQALSPVNGRPEPVRI